MKLDSPRDDYQVAWTGWPQPLCKRYELRGRPERSSTGCQARNGYAQMRSDLVKMCKLKKMRPSSGEKDGRGEGTWFPGRTNDQAKANLY